MPSKDAETPRRRSKRDEDDLKSRRKEDSDTAAAEKTRRRYKRQSSPDQIRPGATTRAKSPDAKKLSRASMADVSSRLKAGLSADVPEMSRRASVAEPKTSSYPSFSKEHSREAVRPLDELAGTKSKVSAATTESEDKKRPEGGSVTGENVIPKVVPRDPPSPPLTSDEREQRRPASATGGRRSHDGPRRDTSRPGTERLARTYQPHVSADDLAGQRPASPSNTTKRPDGATRVRRDPRASPRNSWYSSHSGSPTKARDEARNVAHGVTRVDSHIDSKPSSRVKAWAGMAARPRFQPTVESDDQTTPTQSTTAAMPKLAQNIPLRSFSQPIPRSPPLASPPKWQQETHHGPDTSVTPPPPPQMGGQIDAPRVDYLLINGGLPHAVPRALLARTSNIGPVLTPAQTSSHADASALFTPILHRINAFNTVLERSGSVAVATGYRSVARKLLDRLEHVFARNISSEKCLCVMCIRSPTASQVSTEEQTGISWGEILEYVSGRQELPQWPPFSLDSVNGSRLAAETVDRPMQNLDPDVPDEFRQHYMRQNDKTKRSVQNWLQGQNSDNVSRILPNDVDDETLSFAMLTRLGPEQQAIFTALMKGTGGARGSQLSTDTGVDDAAMVLNRTGLALQRLYRLNVRPRNPDCCMYLLNNHELHSILSTLAAVSPAEWDILISGRFDGFLWTGTENSAFNTDPSEFSRTASRGPPSFSRIGSPLNGHAPSRNHNLSPAFSIPRRPTPMSTSSNTSARPSAGPVQHDEETEIAALFELERTIYSDMELLENAFESIHQSAEALRMNLRARATGLTMAAQARRGSLAGGEDGVRLGTPASLWGIESVFDDGRSELAPDDSASMIGYNRRRREKERKTPGLEHVGGGGTAAEKRRYR